MIPIAIASDAPNDTAKFSHYWRIRKWLPERYGHPCRLLATGKMNSVLIEFGDGVRQIVSRYSIRKLAMDPMRSTPKAGTTTKHNC